jgi:DNA invertase Pin-like site-specific DNA recombinase
MHTHAYLRASTKQQDARRAKKDPEAFCSERASRSSTPISRTRVSLADTTIYEMEQRGEFP